MKSIMIDIETLSTQANAVILSVGVQPFDPLDKGFDETESYYAKLTLESQEDRHIDDKTIEWWATQPREIQERALGAEDRIPLEEALKDIHKLAWHAEHIWVQRPIFDIVILENAYRSLDLPVPWSFWKIRDSGTVVSLTPDLVKPPVQHDALKDCHRQITMVQDSLDYLKVRVLK